MKKYIKKPHSRLISLLIAILIVICGTWFGTKDVEYPFEVHFIDVGQADAALLFCGDETMLIDGGNAEDSNVIAAYLKKYAVTHLDYLICSHAHEDHAGGLSGALSVVSVGAVYAPQTESDAKFYRNFLQKTKAQGLSVSHPAPGDTLSFGESFVEFMGPITEKTDELNNTSLVLKITFGETSFLFTGDAERDEELSILDAGFDVSATVLKVGHHGSSSSTSYPFLREVMPEYAVISVGENTYGHPTEKVLSRLRDVGAEVLRTDRMGDIILQSDGSTIKIA